jgi:hypothetical protein
MKYFYYLGILILMVGKVWALYPNHSLVIVDMAKDNPGQYLAPTKVDPINLKKLSPANLALYQQIDADIAELQASIYQLNGKAPIVNPKITQALTVSISTLRQQQQQLLDDGYVKSETKKKLLIQLVEPYQYVFDGPDRYIMGSFSCMASICPPESLASTIAKKALESALQQIRVILLDQDSLASNIDSKTLPEFEPFQDYLIYQWRTHQLNIVKSTKTSCPISDFCVADNDGKMTGVFQQLGFTPHQLTIAQLPVVNNKYPTDAQRTYNLVREALLAEAGRRHLSVQELRGLTTAINSLTTLSATINQPESSDLLSGLSKLGRRLINLVTNFNFADPNDPGQILENLIQELPSTIKKGVEVHIQFLSLETYTNFASNSTIAPAKKAFNTALTTIQNEVSTNPDVINIQTEADMLTAADVINKLDITSMIDHQPSYLNQLVTATKNLLINIDSDHASTDSDSRVLSYLAAGATALVVNNLTAVSDNINHIVVEQPDLFATKEPYFDRHHDIVSGTVVLHNAGNDLDYPSVIINSRTNPDEINHYLPNLDPFITRENNIDNNDLDMRQIRAY